MKKLILALVVLLSFKCSSPVTISEVTLNPEPKLGEASQSSALKIAVISDFGMDAIGGAKAELAVSQLVKSWNPAAIITMGDNNYPDGEWETIDQNIGKYFSDYIYPYQGKFKTNSLVTENRFFAVLGNHDWNCKTCIDKKLPLPHLKYFNLPGNERWYDVKWGAVHAFILDSDPRVFNKEQTDWLQAKLMASRQKFKFVFLHHPPFSSGVHGNQKKMDLPFKDWGVTAVFAGHDHHYERIETKGITYFVGGHGANKLYPMPNLHRDSRIRYNANQGAILLNINEQSVVVEAYSVDNQLIDSVTFKN